LPVSTVTTRAGTRVERRGETGHRDPIGERVQIGQILGEPAVDQHDPGTVELAESEPVEIVPRDRARVVLAPRKKGRGDRGDPRLAPLLVLRGREAGLLEALERVAAQLSGPRGTARAGLANEIDQVGFLVHRYFPAAAPESSVSIQP
jgi:hypothetical protein